MKSFIIGAVLTFMFPQWSMGQLVQTDYSPKFSAATVSKIQSYHLQRPTREGTESAECLFAYVRLKPGADVEYLCRQYRMRLNVTYGNTYTAVIPMALLEELAKEDAVLDVDAGKEIHMMMDSVRILTHVDDIHEGLELPKSYQGEGIVIGIIDIGFDFTHPNFRDENGNCRIKCVWDQNRLSATPNSSYGYGTVYAATENILDAKHDLSGETHGTHVAGIATGSADRIYKGVAPKADIVLVSVNKTEVGIVDAIDFLIRYAEEVNKPLSMNLSMGTVLGYKDGTDRFSMLIDNLMKNRKGKLLSVAAGNAGNGNSTVTGTFDDVHQTVKSFLVPPSYNSDNLFVQGFDGHVCTFTISLKDTVRHVTLFSESFVSGEPWSKSFEKFGSGDDNDARLNISCSSNPANNNPAFNVRLSYTKPREEAWEIAFSSTGGKYLINSDYGTFTAANKEGYAEGCKDYTIASSATGFEPVIVGAYVSREKYTDISGKLHISGWQKHSLYPLSGKGPTYDGRIRPDVAAPGATVISSFNSYAASYSVPATDRVWEMEGRSGRKYTWGIANGTSMATPVVTGTLALWLQANPELTLGEVREIIRKTAIHDIYTGDHPNGKYGMGKLNAVAGLQEVLHRSSVPENGYQVIDYAYDRNSGRVKVLSDTPLVRIDIYSVSGERMDVLNDPGNNEFYMNHFPAGVYLIKVQTQNTSKIFKVVRS